MSSLFLIGRNATGRESPGDRNNVRNVLNDRARHSLCLARSILLCQFSNEFEVSAGQVDPDPIVNTSIQFGREVVLPITCLTCVSFIRE